MENREKVLKNLLELSKKGVGGEAKNAEALLNKLLDKYNLKLEDIDNSEEVKDREFIFNNEWEEKLVNQLAYAMYPDRPTYSYTYKRLKKNRQTIILKLTDSEYIQFAYAYDIYKEALKQDMLIFYHAFISKNQIFPPQTEENLSKATDISEIYSRDELAKMSVFGMGIEQVNVIKALETGEN